MNYWAAASSPSSSKIPPPPFFGYIFFLIFLPTDSNLGYIGSKLLRLRGVVMARQEPAMNLCQLVRKPFLLVMQFKTHASKNSLHNAPRLEKDETKRIENPLSCSQFHSSLIYLLLKRAKCVWNIWWARPDPLFFSYTLVSLCIPNRSINLHSLTC